MDLSTSSFFLINNETNDDLSGAATLQQQDFDCFTPTDVETISSPVIRQFLTFLYSLTTAVALIGNVIVILVQLQNHEVPRRNLRKYLINLAVADIIFAVFCVPITYMDFMNGRWDFPAWLCPMTQYVQLLSVFITANTLTIIGIERYTVALYPFSGFYHWLQKNANSLIVLIWIVGSTYSYFPIKNTYVNEYVMDDNETVYCECSYDNELSRENKRIYMIFNLVLTFVLPLVVLVCSYSAIMRRLIWLKSSLYAEHITPEDIKYSSQPNLNEMTSSIFHIDCIEMKTIESSRPKPPFLRSNSQYYNKTAIQRTFGDANDRATIIKIILVIIVVYCVCWGPMKVYQFLVEYELVWFCTETQYHAQVYIYMVCHWLAMASSFSNPIVYSFMSRRFRNDFRKIVLKYARYFANKINFCT